MGYKIENQVTNYGTRNSINNLIIAHETANSNSTIEGEVAYMKRNASSAFVTHFVGGGGRIIQTAPVGKVSWGAGPKANGYAYAQIELCRAKDKATFQKDYATYIWLLRDLASKAGIPKTLDAGSSVYDKGIKSHKWVSDKLGGTDHQDPYGYLASRGISKEQFAKDISGGLGSASPTPTSSKPAAPKPQQTGNTVVKVIQKTVGVTQDGWDGPNTRKGVVKLFQRYFGANADGYVGNETLSKSKTIRKGDKGLHVYAIQAMLYLKGYTVVGNPDQIAGNNTVQAIKDFQKANGLSVDGIAGRNTYAKLLKL